MYPHGNLKNQSRKQGKCVHTYPFCEVASRACEASPLANLLGITLRPRIKIKILSNAQVLKTFREAQGLAHSFCV